MSSYCEYCGTRCFVDRVLADGRWVLLRTCLRGMAHDQQLWGQDYQTATNPHVHQ